MALAVRKDSDTATGADGDYSPLQLDFVSLKTKARLQTLEGGSVWTDVGTATGNFIPVRVPGSTTATRTQVADNAADVQILAVNTAREKYAITNDSTAILYLADGATAASLTNYTVQIQPGGYFENTSYTGEVRGIWATDPGTGAARITEYT